MENVLVTTRSPARLAALIALPVALIAGLIAFWGLGGFRSGATPSPVPSTRPDASQPVPMSAPSLSPADAQMCLAFIAALPVSLNGLAERHVSAGSEQNAGYGDPAVTAACGAPKAAYHASDEVYVLQHVCWYEVSVKNATVWTTLDRKVPVAVTVPDSYAQPGQWTILFSGPLIQAMPSISDVPAGCHGA